jgi:alkylation response protein AidB-like acyl-CoA dehydrogenase
MTLEHPVDLSFTKEEEEFRTELRAWLDTHLPQEMRRPDFWAGKSDDEQFQIRRDWEAGKAEAGFAGIQWPTEYGGRGGTPGMKAIYDMEMVGAGAPTTVNPLGLTFLAPTVDGARHRGAEARDHQAAAAQRGHLVPGLLRARAGSDLAALSMRAEQQGEEYLLNGQKIWTTNAMHGDKIFTMVRTGQPVEGQKKHAGISMLLVDMHQPGVEARPLKQMTGSSEFGEVFFTDATCPVTEVLGGEGNGWATAMLLLSFERGSSAMGQYTEFRKMWDEVAAAAAQVDRDGPRPPRTRSCARTWPAAVELECLKYHSWHILTQTSRGKDLGFEASMTKLQWSETFTKEWNAYTDVVGAYYQAPELKPGVSLERGHDPSRCGPAPAPSGAARPRSSAPSSPSACSASPARGRARPCTSRSPTSSAPCRTPSGPSCATASAPQQVRARLRGPRRRRRPRRAVEGRGRAGLARRPRPRGVRRRRARPARRRRPRPGLRRRHRARPVAARPCWPPRPSGSPAPTSRRPSTCRARRGREEGRRGAAAPQRLPHARRRAADRSGDTVSGRLELVDYAHVADLLVVAATDGGLLLVDPRGSGVTIERFEALDRTTRMAHVTLDGRPWRSSTARPSSCRTCSTRRRPRRQRPRRHRPQGDHRHRRVRQDARAVRQAGRLVPGDQARPRRPAQPRHLRRARRDVRRARGRHRRGRPSPGRLGRKAKAAEAADAATSAMIQYHGGIGYTWEHDTHFYFKRSKRLEGAYGDAAQHRERIAQLVIDGGRSGDRRPRSRPGGTQGVAGHRRRGGAR